MRNKKFPCDTRGAAAAGVTTVAIIATLFVPAGWAALVSIVNTLGVALVLRPRRRCDRRDGAAALVAAAEVLVALVVPAASTAVGIASSLLIALSLRQR